jgi:hypothetical protein
VKPTLYGMVLVHFMLKAPPVAVAAVALERRVGEGDGGDGTDYALGRQVDGDVELAGGRWLPELAGRTGWRQRPRAITKMSFFMTVLQLERKQGQGQAGQTGQIESEWTVTRYFKNQFICNCNRPSIQVICHVKPLKYLDLFLNEVLRPTCKKCNRHRLMAIFHPTHGGFVTNLKQPCPRPCKNKRFLFKPK